LLHILKNVDMRVQILNLRADVRRDIVSVALSDVDSDTCQKVEVDCCLVFRVK